MESPDTQDGSSSLRRALNLLDTFTPARSQMSIRELAERSGTSRSTTHRLVQELLRWGALERGPGGLKLGVKLFELGTRAPAHVTLREAASPFLHTLVEVTRLTANLAIREGEDIVYLEKIGSASLTVPHSRLGGRGLPHATALGKAILAFSPAEVIDPYFRNPLGSLTERTITDRKMLFADLERVRKAGVAFDVEESCKGLFCVAAPVRSAGGHALGALSVTGATALSQAEKFAPTVITAARAIERQLHARPSRLRQ